MRQQTTCLCVVPHGQQRGDGICINGVQVPAVISVAQLGSLYQQKDLHSSLEQTNPISAASSTV